MKVKILNIVLALVFLASGGAKLAGLPFEIAAFERWGYPLWFMTLVGAFEVTAGISLLVKRLSALAAMALAAMMTGAMATHVGHNEWGMLLAATMIFTLSAARALAGRSELCALLPHKRAPTLGG